MKKDDIILAEVDGEGMIIDVERGSSHFLNETALFIFKMRKDGKSVDEIKSALLKKYDVEDNVAETDIRELVAKLDRKVMTWERKNT